MRWNPFSSEPVKRQTSTQRIGDHVLFVWNGKPASLQLAEEFLSTLATPIQRLTVLRVLPHESIYSYGAIRNQGQRVGPLVYELEQEFAQQAARARYFEGFKPVLLFGDRLQEVCLYARRSHANLILHMPLEQSSFSRWIHGDLNERLTSQAPCAVRFLSPAMVPSRGGEDWIDQTQQPQMTDQGSAVSHHELE